MSQVQTFGPTDVELNLVIPQDRTFSFPARLWNLNEDGSKSTPLDVTGYEAQMQIRAAVDAPAIIFDATPYIVVGGADGRITLTLTPAITAAFAWTGGVYDFLIKKGGVSTPLFYGRVSLKKAITRP